jgi:hypothetical protein
MSTLALVMNITLTLMALTAFAIGMVIAGRLKASPDLGGRADGRGPGSRRGPGSFWGGRQRIVASIATTANSRAR